jgi:outer membrane protein assembly factor BamB
VRALVHWRDVARLKVLRLGGAAMKAIASRLTSAILGCVFCTAFSNGTAAEEVGSVSPSSGACPAAVATGFADPMSVPHWNGWGVDSSQRRFQSAETAQLAAEDVPRLKLKWAFGFPGAKFAFAQPTVMGGRVFVGSEGGKVYSLDANSGCIY